MKREENRGPERFIESSYQLISDMVSHILDQISNLPQSTNSMSMSQSKSASPPPPSPSRPSDRYEELIAENKRLSTKIKDFAASSHRETVKSDEEMIAIRVILLIIRSLTSSL